MKRFFALFILLCLLFAGCIPEAQAPASPTTEPSSSVPEDVTEPSRPATDPVTPSPEEPEITTETVVDDYGNTIICTKDPSGKVLYRIIYNQFSDITTKMIYEYSENGFCNAYRSYSGFGNIMEEFAANNYENSFEYAESVPIDVYVNPENAFTVTIDELAPLYRQAEEIWNTYGVVVLIADKVTEYRGSADLCLEYEWIKPNLDIIESCLATYPKDFFRCLDRTTCIQLAGTDASSAGSYFPDERIDMVQMDVYCYQPELDDADEKYARSTLNHELCHVIDYQLQEWAEESELPFTEEQWNTLNPEGFTYVGKHDFDLEADKYFAGENYQYFVSSYSCSHPEEDRATLFQEIMVDPDFELTEQLRAKLQYFSDCIRAAFPSDDWDDVVAWERILNR